MSISTVGQQLIFQRGHVRNSSCVWHKGLDVACRLLIAQVFISISLYYHCANKISITADIYDQCISVLHILSPVYVVTSVFMA